ENLFSDNHFRRRMDLVLVLMWASGEKNQFDEEEALAPLQMRESIEKSGAMSDGGHRVFKRVYELEIYFLSNIRDDSESSF
ncbi:16451_t:CDS:2, partial [Funneliformis mosseae]